MHREGVDTPFFIVVLLMFGQQQPWCCARCIGVHGIPWGIQAPCWQQDIVLCGAVLRYLERG